MKELILSRGFRYGAVAEAIGVAPHTMTRWTDNAPIGKLLRISRFTGIDILELISCFDTDPSQPAQDDRTGGEENN